MTDPATKQDAQPTPGPWRVDEKAKNEASVSVRGADNWAICACRATAPDGSRYHMNVARANARLIAAAPATAAERDRLEAANAELASTLEDAETFLMVKARRDPQERAIVEQIRAVLKARGPAKEPTP